MELAAKILGSTNRIRGNQYTGSNAADIIYTLRKIPGFHPMLAMPQNKPLMPRDYMPPMMTLNIINMHLQNTRISYAVGLAVALAVAKCPYRLG